MEERNAKQKKLIEQLRLEVVCPAKGRSLKKRIGCTLVNSNYRYVGENEKTLWEWLELFGKEKLDFEIELKLLVQKEFGQKYDAKQEHFPGYLGASANTSYEVCKKVK